MRALRASGVALAVLACACSGLERRLEKRPAFRRVSPNVAFEMMRDSPGLPVVDLREPEEFAGPSGHLRNARNLPLADVERLLRVFTYFRELAPLRESTFLVYCRELDGCAEEGMRRFVAAGYRNAVMIEGGIETWTRGGYGALGPDAPEVRDRTRSEIEATHWRRLADGRLFEGGREQATGLYVAGRLKGDRFLPAGGVEGTGEFCVALARRAPRRPRTGWLELRDGRFYADSSPREPSRPYVRGCVDGEGRFLPDSRDVV
ncbi:MAG: rhodanese-like domain-containing protein [Thermoanaerobaculia bacterium]|nr:MAG: rhodanese-like domain-containing protein [Thermoanaerobaculia bacterium]